MAAIAIVIILLVLSVFNLALGIIGYGSRATGSALLIVDCAMVIINGVIIAYIISSAVKDRRRRSG